MKTPIYLLAALLLLFFWAGCQPESNDLENLDPVLTETLMAASNGSGLSYFQLPDSDDFNAIPQDPRNPLTREKVALGRLLYHETALAIHPKYEDGRNSYSCASCHHAQGGFQACVVQGIADGGTGFGLSGEARLPNPAYGTNDMDVQPIRTPSVLNAAYQEVQLWNGQFGATGMNEGTEDRWTEGTPKFNNHLGYHGVETQAIAGLTVHRMGVDTQFIFNSDYKALFDLAFPSVPQDVRYTLETTGLAIAAYERTVLANEAPFQQWLRGDHAAMTDEEKQGAILFFGKADCASCHTGPALNSMAFYGLGMHDLDGPGVYGTGVDDATSKGRGGFTGNPEDNYKFKVPQLYSLIFSPHYGHGGNFKTVEDVVKYKNRAIPENPEVPESQLASEFVPLNLTHEEVRMITAFIEEGLKDDKLERYTPNGLPSGQCFPNNDPLSSIDLGCY